MPTATIGSAGVVRLRAGRSVTFFAAGPQHGFPVVYCHGAIGSPRWHTPGLDAVIEQLSIRYIVVNRPGFGGSDPEPGRTVADHAHDVGELMTILGCRRFSVVGVSAGAPHALACGGALADRLVALAAVSPLGPPDGAGATPSLRYKVPLVPYGSPRVGPALAHLSLRALGLQRQTCAQAMIDDYLVCRRSWGFDPADLRVPVTLWHGRGDRLTTCSGGGSTRPLGHCCGHLTGDRRAGGRDPGVRGPRGPWRRAFLLQPQADGDPRVAAARGRRRRIAAARGAAPSRLTAATIRACGHRS